MKLHFVLLPALLTGACSEYGLFGKKSDDKGGDDSEDTSIDTGTPVDDGSCTDSDLGSFEADVDDTLKKDEETRKELSESKPERDPEERRVLALTDRVVKAMGGSTQGP